MKEYFVMEEAVTTSATEVDWLIARLEQARYTRVAEWVNRHGQRVTWSSNEDGTRQLLQTWPNQRGVGE